MTFFEILPWVLCLGLGGSIFTLLCMLPQRDKSVFLEGVRDAYGSSLGLPNVVGQLALRSASIHHAKGNGAGLLLDSEYLLTAAHVIHVKGDFPIAFAESPRSFWSAQKLKVVALDDVNDIALCRLERTVVTLKLEPLMMSPLGYKITYEDGFLDGQGCFLLLRKKLLGLRAFLKNSPVEPSKTLLIAKKETEEHNFLPGDSGSVGLDLQGKICALCTASFHKDEGIKNALGVGPNLEVIHTFLAAHWPNYQG
jgi:hypothetical protein